MAPALALLVLAACFLIGCSRGDEPIRTDATPSDNAERAEAELDGVRVASAWETLRAKLGQDAQLLEVRADHQGLVVQVVRSFEPSLEIVEFWASLEASGGRVDVEGPIPIALRGAGDAKENAFLLAELDVSRITAAFPVARLAVDPADGQVRQLVIRRMLPFNRLVRARIFVHSPRMSGIIDTNSGGTPLKQ